MIGENDMRPPLRNALDRVWVDPEPSQTVRVWVRDPSNHTGVSVVVHENVKDVKVYCESGAGFMDLAFVDGHKAGHPLHAVLRWEVTAG